MNYNVLSEQQALRKLWCCAALIPNNMTMDETLFLKCMDPSSRSLYPDFVRTGLILKTSPNQIALVPSARWFCLDEMHPHDRDCEAFLSQIWNVFHKQGHGEQRRSAIACHLSALEYLADADGTYAHRLAQIMYKEPFLDALYQDALARKAVRPLNAAKVAKLHCFTAAEVLNNTRHKFDLQQIVSNLSKAMTLVEYAEELQKKWLPRWHKDLEDTTNARHHIRSMLDAYQILLDSGTELSPMPEEYAPLLKLLSEAEWTDAD